MSLERTSMCSIALTHLEAGPALLHAELIEDARQGGMDERSCHTADEPAAEPILILVDAAKYHAALSKRNPWLQPPSPSPSFRVLAASVSSLSADRDSSAAPALPAAMATVLHNTALGMKTWQVLTSARICVRRSFVCTHACALPTHPVLIFCRHARQMCHLRRARRYLQARTVRSTAAGLVHSRRALARTPGRMMACAARRIRGGVWILGHSRISTLCVCSTEATAAGLVCVIYMYRHVCGWAQSLDSLLLLRRIPAACWAGLCAICNQMRQKPSGHYSLTRGRRMRGRPARCRLPHHVRLRPAPTFLTRGACGTAGTGSGASKLCSPTLPTGCPPPPLPRANQGKARARQELVRARPGASAAARRTTWRPLPKLWCSAAGALGS